MKKKLILLIAISILIGAGLFVFRERPLMPLGFSIARVERYISLRNVTLAPDRHPVEYNSGYPNAWNQVFLSISTDELEDILATARRRLSIRGTGVFSMADMQYVIYTLQFYDGETSMLMHLHLGTNSWASVGRADSFRRTNYRILNAEELMEALNSAKSMEPID